MNGRYQRLMSRVAAGERILIDGAVGTEVERLGVPKLPNAWNGGAALTHPDMLRRVHEAYFQAGAEVAIANTFSTHAHALRQAGIDDRFEALNRRGVELAVEARWRSGASGALVAGGIAYWSWTSHWPTADEVAADVQPQAAIMAAAGADLLIMEMMIDARRTAAAMKAARRADLPSWVGLAAELDDAGRVRMQCSDDALADVAATARDEGAELIAIMHTDVGAIDACLDQLATVWDGPVGVYAHAARWTGSTWDYEGNIAPCAHAGHASRWLDRGVQVIGGCCGLGLDHVAALRPLVGDPQQAAMGA